MRIFLTGATGFLGRHLLARLDAAHVWEVRCLVRGGPRALAASPHGPVVVPVEGDLRGASLADALKGCDAVVHLAALTGKASERDLEAVNVEGTRRLLAAAREAGVPRFLHVSTIAVSYPETRHYPYARSKQRAELLVRDSGLDWLIVRPTVVFGHGSAVGKSLAALAAAPVLPLFGGGTSRVQPLHVTDMVRVLRQRLREPSLGERVEDVGGRDVVAFGEFLRALRRALRGSEGPALSIPLGPLLPLLAALEPAMLRVLPVTAGQLYAFRHDGVAREGVDPADVAARKGVAEIVAELAGVPLDASSPGEGSGGTASAAAAEAPGTTPPRATLVEECALFVPHLAGLPASPYVIAKYVQAHEAGQHGPLRSTDDEDDVLVAFARRGPGSLKLAEAWAALFDRSGPLRRKLVLLLALLESGVESEQIDRPDPGGYAAFTRSLLWRGATFLVTLVIALFVVGPRWILSGGRAGREGDAS